MELRLKENAIDIPKDRYGKDCPQAVIINTETRFNYKNKQLFVEWEMFRSKQGYLDGEERINYGTCIWEKNPKSRRIETLEPEERNEEGEITKPAVTKLIEPGYGAFDNVTNVVATTASTEFGEIGATWILSFDMLKEWEIAS